jgi:N-acetylglutamate synthase-like GNAT family acetyltransferase
MQIRIGNKQDESEVRTLVSQLLDEAGQKLDLNGIDKDLKQIEIHYFGHDGVFLVAEQERTVFGFAAALQSTDTVCELRRLYVNKEHRRSGAGSLLLKQVISFAKQLDYQQLIVPETSLTLDGAADFLLAHSFTKTDTNYRYDLH